MSGWHWGLGRLHRGTGPSTLQGCYGSHSTAPWWRSSQRSEQITSGELRSSARRPRSPSGGWDTHHDDGDHQSSQTNQVELLGEQLDEFIVTALDGDRKKSMKTGPAQRAEEAKRPEAPWVLNPKCLKLCLEDTWDLRKSSGDFLGHKVPATCLKRAVSSPLPQQSSWKMEKTEAVWRLSRKKWFDCWDGSTS